jgi:hypothetical protein
MSLPFISSPSPKLPLVIGKQFPSLNRVSLNVLKVLFVFTVSSLPTI